MSSENLETYGPSHTPAGLAAALRGPHYRGWSVLSGGFLCAMLAVGGTLYAYGFFVVPVGNEFGLSRANVNNGHILMLLGMAIWSPFIGRLLDSISARWVMSGGALLLAAGFVAIGTTSSLFVMGAARALPRSGFDIAPT